jgi:hypothetical protein
LFCHATWAIACAKTQRQEETRLLFTLRADLRDHRVGQYCQRGASSKRIDQRTADAKD